MDLKDLENMSCYDPVTDTQANHPFDRSEIKHIIITKKVYPLILRNYQNLLRGKWRVINEGKPNSFTFKPVEATTTSKSE
ncbi:hypothetical protein SAE01_36540 [Segetibacter aerophilus]|uniref:Uncharacterized protein n=2 Tax=Segetibacter aerophilus TaxID=670293 RepID=A0A512BGR3_9BACT|nr:hypothetical protein SAE01_36540 [Segetibacter aerophilus]